MRSDKNKLFIWLSNVTVFLIPACCLIASVIIATKTTHQGYRFMFLMPIIYMGCFLAVFRKRIFGSKSLFVTSFAAICFLRYVVLPLLIVFSGLYGGRAMSAPQDSAYTKAIFLMMYEIVAVSVVIALLYKTNTELVPNVSYETPSAGRDSKLIYIGLFLVTILMVIIRPGSLNHFSFITTHSVGGSYLESPSALESVALYLLFTSKIVLYVLLQLYLRNKYFKTRLFRYKALSYALLLLNMCIFYGMNRMDLILPAIASIVFEIQLFEEKHYWQYVVAALVLIIIVGNITSARHLTSYSKGFLGSYNQMIDITDVFQGYLGGPYNVAISVETYSYFPEVRNLGRLLFDIFRPMIGVNVFLKGSAMEMSNSFFNRRIWSTNFSSQIIPMIGQGYLYFGAIFSPLLSCAIALLANRLEVFSCKTHNPIMRYVVLMCILRCGMLMGQGVSNIVNELSMNLLLTSLVVWASTRIKINNGVVSYEKSF